MSIYYDLYSRCWALRTQAKAISKRGSLTLKDCLLKKGTI